MSFEFVENPFTTSFCLLINSRQKTWKTGIDRTHKSNHIGQMLKVYLLLLVPQSLHSLGCNLLSKPFSVGMPNILHSANMFRKSQIMLNIFLLQHERLIYLLKLFNNLFAVTFIQLSSLYNSTIIVFIMFTQFCA